MAIHITFLLRTFPCLCWGWHSEPSLCQPYVLTVCRRLALPNFELQRRCIIAASQENIQPSYWRLRTEGAALSDEVKTIIRWLSLTAHPKVWNVSDAHSCKQGTANPFIIFYVDKDSCSHHVLEDRVVVLLNLFAK